MSLKPVYILRTYKQICHKNSHELRSNFFIFFSQNFHFTIVPLRHLSSQSIKNDTKNIDNSTETDEVSRKTDVLSSDSLNIAFNETKNKGVSALRKRALNFLGFIEEVSHLDEVRTSQSRVMEIKDRLKQSGDHKREILFELNLIRMDIQKNHSEICNSVRGTERYVTLVQEEVVHLQNEKRKLDEFARADERERQLFNALSAAINDSYEKEKIHSHILKTWGLIGTLAATVVTLISAALGLYYHNIKFGTLQDSLRLDIISALKKQEEILKSGHGTNESWAGYIKRHSANVYHWFIPRK